MLFSDFIKTTLFTSILILFGIMPSLATAQNSHGKEFHRLFYQADSLSELGQYAAAGQRCDQALEMKGGLFPDSGYYRTSFYYWLDAGNQERAIFYLEKIVRFGWLSEEAMVALRKDEGFELVRSAKGFEELLAIQAAKREKYGTIADKLLDIKNKDQTLRQLLSCAREKFADDSLQMNNYYDLMRYQDSINLIYVAAVLNQYGWLGENKIGERPNKALWQVIQHSSLDVQERYLPLLKESAENGESRMSNFAFLQDRVLMKRGKKQRYGTQITKHPTTGKSAVYPVEDPLNIDSIRASVGFEPIKEYAAFFDIEITSPADLDDQEVLEYWQNQHKKE